MNDMFLDDTDLGGMIESVDAVSSEPEITVDKPEEISNNEPSEPPEHQLIQSFHLNLYHLKTYHS